MLSAKSIALDFDLSGRSFMWMRKRSEPNIDPWGTPAKIDLHDNVWPFRITLWSLPDK